MMNEYEKVSSEMKNDSEIASGQKSNINDGIYSISINYNNFFIVLFTTI